MNSCVTKLEEIEFIAGDSGAVLEFQLFYENGDVLDLQDDTAVWLLAPIGNKHNPKIKKRVTTTENKDGKIIKDKDEDDKLLCYRFQIFLSADDTKDLYGKYIHQPILIDRYGRAYRRAEGFINFKRPIISDL